jgi:hypothetical protein
MALAAIVLTVVVVALLPVAARAATAMPGFTINAVAGPTMFSAEHDGAQPPDTYTLTVTNSGNEPTDGSAISIADTLPAGLHASEIGGLVGVSEELRFLTCDLPNVTCAYDGVLQPGEHIVVIVTVTVAPGTASPVTDSATVSGGGAPTVSANATNTVGSAAESLAVPYGFAALEQQVTGQNGLLDGQAGDHPFEQTLSFSLNSVGGGEIPEFKVAGGFKGGSVHTKDIVVDLPPGFVGDPGAIQKCTQYDVSNNKCPPNTQIGEARLGLAVRSPKITQAGGFAGGQWPIYNVVPDKGYPAEFVIPILREIPAPLYVEVDPKRNYGLRIVTPGIPEAGAPLDVAVTFFGTPVTDRNVFNEQATVSSGSTPVAFLDDPTMCSTAPLMTKVSIDAWEKPGGWLPDGSPDISGPNWVSASTSNFPSLEGCELLQFNPSITVTPDTTQADEPAGVSVDVKLPQAAQQFPALITPALKDSTVTLPAGMSISPSGGDGLQGCSDTQIALLSETAGACPSGSVLGTAKVTTPLLPEPLEGHVFLRTPNCDPCTNADASDGNMFRIFLEVQGSGVVVKKEGTIDANTSTGQLTTTFKETPQVPVSDIQLQFKGGLRAALATPQTCGAFTTTSDLTPWSSPVTPDGTPSSTFNVDWDGNGGACPAGAPLTPAFSAGTSNPNAGQFSPLTLTFSREDREQDLSGIQVHMPSGLLGSLSGIPLCGETQAQLGTCSSASRIGTMTVAAGPGSHPFYEKGSIYLTEPYEDAPFGLSIVVPTVAGPFNLGNVVVRAKINVDRSNAALTVTSDPFPQILDGIPLRLRTANVTIDRPGFIFNPSNCSQQSITATISGAQGAQAHVSAPFAVAGCRGLKFAPSFKVSTSGRTSRAAGASLDAKLVYPKGAQGTDVNIAKVKVALPKQLPSRLTTLQKACTARQFESNPAGCPAGSVIGIARATTPLLPVALTGPAYFVSHGGEAFPSLEIVLQGYGVRVDLVGATFISKAGITSSTFKSVPDVPVGTFELYLPQGKNSALAANGNLCKAKLAMPTAFVAQDGQEIHKSTKVAVTGCPKAVATKKAKRAKKANSARKDGKARGPSAGQGGNRRGNS